MLFRRAAGNNLYRLRISTLAHFGILVGVNRNSAGRASTHRCKTDTPECRRTRRESRHFLRSEAPPRWITGFPETGY
jgi:hypothetical protein